MKGKQEVINNGNEEISHSGAQGFEGKCILLGWCAGEAVSLVEM